VQRILLELLNQMDGFDQQTNVKVLKENIHPFSAVWLLFCAVFVDTLVASMFQYTS